MSKQLFAGRGTRSRLIGLLLGGLFAFVFGGPAGLLAFSLVAVVAALVAPLF